MYIARCAHDVSFPMKNEMRTPQITILVSCLQPSTGCEKICSDKFQRRSTCKRGKRATRTFNVIHGIDCTCTAAISRRYTKSYRPQSQIRFRIVKFIFHNISFSFFKLIIDEMDSQSSTKRIKFSRLCLTQGRVTKHG